MRPEVLAAVQLDLQARARRAAAPTKCRPLRAATPAEPVRLRPFLTRALARAAR